MEENYHFLVIEEIFPFLMSVAEEGFLLQSVIIQRMGTEEGKEEEVRLKTQRGRLKTRYFSPLKSDSQHHFLDIFW